MNAPAKTSIPYIRAAGGLTVVLKGRPYSIAKDDKNYEEIVQALKDGLSEDHVLNCINAAAAALQVATQVTSDIKIVGGIVYYQGKAVDNSLTERMLKMLEEGFDLLPMANFMSNLMKNPSYRAVNELYSFLEKGKMPITPDGHFMAYKAVRNDYMDIHSGTFDNSIGKICEMDRNGVDEDRDRTCSHGLHFCSFDYLQHFANSDGHVMLVKINPADVVSIPADYNDTKGRCCRYEVVSEYEGYYDKGGPYFKSMVYDPSTGVQSGASTESDSEEGSETEYTLYGLKDKDDEGDGHCYDYLGTFQSLDEAKEEIANNVDEFALFIIEDDDEDEVYREDGNYEEERYIVKVNGVEHDSYDELHDAKHEAVDLANGSATVTVEDQSGNVILRLS